MQEKERVRKEIVLKITQIVFIIIDKTLLHNFSTF